MKIFRDAAWIDDARVMRWGIPFAVAFLLFLVWDGFVHTTHGLTDAAGEHIGRDFINYWSGAKLASGGRAAIAYDLKEYFGFQKSIAGEGAEFKLYSYPPVMMLLTLPLALCSFFAGYLLWSLGGYALMVKLLSRDMPQRMALTAAIAAPACFLNLQSGQNGFFTAALLAGGLMLLGRKPVIAGILFGLLCYKPQLGLLLPIALAAGGHWRSFISAGITVAALVAASTLAFGVDIWPAFLQQMREQGDLLARGDTLWPRMPSVYCALRLIGVDSMIASAAQILAAIAAIAGVIMAWRSKAPDTVKHTVLLLGIFLSSPYSWDYDMAVLVFGAAWIAQAARAGGYLPYEKITWLLVILLPFLTLISRSPVPVNIGPVVLFAAFYLTLRRARVT
ncbi:MAG: glycosyltransferase family 87 protein [bacterium]|nr:glycosyltransferase family 87 protein [bacterium]